MDMKNDNGKITFLDDKTIFTIPNQEENETEKSKWLRMKKLMATQGINLTGDFSNNLGESES
jgi:hypothetical protein